MHRADYYVVVLYIVEFHSVASMRKLFPLVTRYLNGKQTPSFPAYLRIYSLYMFICARMLCPSLTVYLYRLCYVFLWMSTCIAYVVSFSDCLLVLPMLCPSLTVYLYCLCYVFLWMSTCIAYVIPFSECLLVSPMLCLSLNVYLYCPCYALLWMSTCSAYVITYVDKFNVWTLCCPSFYTLGSLFVKK